ncbi:hypothetical protein PHIN8_15420 [Polynucleobacter sp. HIN8]|nr:hypothetical protein PHIN8_15420 [Polynucleobacter sp. HIN8]
MALPENQLTNHKSKRYLFFLISTCEHTNLTGPKFTQLGLNHYAYTILCKTTLQIMIELIRFQNLYKNYAHQATNETFKEKILTA